MYLHQVNSYANNCALTTIVAMVTVSIRHLYNNVSLCLNLPHAAKFCYQLLVYSRVSYLVVLKLYSQLND